MWGSLAVTGYWCLAKPYFINGIIKEQEKLSINLVGEEMLMEVDVSGLVKGR